jgi:hypothetical protein
MAILEKEIRIILSSKLTKHFEKLGYEIPRKKDKWGTMTVPLGTKLQVKVNDLPKGSHIKITKVCDNQGCDITGGRHVKNQQYRAVLIARENNNGIDLCPNCSYAKRALLRKENVKYENSLEYFAIHNHKDYLLDEFSENNIKKPNQISFGTHDKYLWNCLKCGEKDYPMSVANRTSSNQCCPICAGNIIKTTEQFKKDVYSLVGDEYIVLGEYINTKTPIEIEHKECKQSYSVTPNNFLRDRRCPFCTKSKGEIKIREWLDINQFIYIPQMKFDGLIGIGGGNLSYDFYLPNQNLLIEYQGEFHDGSNGEYTQVNLNNQNIHDERKRNYAAKKEINLLEIWYWDFNKIENILLNKLGGIK